MESVHQTQKEGPMPGYRTLIQRNADGVKRWCHFDEPWGDHCDFLWHGGNYSCDCNRAVWFAAAGNEDDPDVECGDFAYSVLKIEMADGTEIDFEDRELHPPPMNE